MGRNLQQLGRLATMLLVCASLSWASAAPQPAPRQAPAGREAGDMKETIQLLMIASMKKELALTRSQEDEVIPKVQKVFAERERYARDRRDALRQIQTKLTLESVPEKDVLSVVRRLDDLERTHRDQELQLRIEIDKALNPRQQAQIRVFVPRFRREMQRRIEEARRLRATPQPPPAPPAEEELDLGEEEY
jgi:Spy/CpxP family protein refolding chaperone